MNGAYETFEVEAGGPAMGLLLPGRVLRALALGAQIPAEDVGLMAPGRHGVLHVEIARARAHRLATPRDLPSHEGGKAALFVLRRDGDEPTLDAARELVISWSDGGLPPAPGEIAAALAEAATAYAGTLFAEDLGFGLAGATFLRVQVPLSLVLRGMPEMLRVGARELKVELADKRRS